MVDWVGKFSSLLKRLKDSWMNLLPLSAMTQEQRESLYQADMTQLNAERRSRNEDAWILVNKLPETIGTPRM